MSGFVAIKAVTLGGVTYQKGAAIPEEAVVPKRVPALIRLKYIARVATEGNPTGVPLSEGDGGGSGEAMVPIPILMEDGAIVLEIELGNIGAALELLQRKAEDAIAKLSEITNDKVLILVDALDQRKTVKAAVKARALKLEDERKAADGTPQTSVSTGQLPLQESQDAAAQDALSDQAEPPPPQGDGKTDDAGEGTGDGGDQ